MFQSNEEVGDTSSLYVCIVCALIAVEPNGACHYPGLVGERYLTVYQPVFLVRTVSFTRIHTTRS